MNLIPTTPGGPATMSTREVADLCEKRHRDVMRDVRTMCEALDIDARSFAHIYKDAQNREQEEYRLPRDLTLTLVTGYNIVLRKRVIDRLDEYERGSNLPSDPTLLGLPDFRDPVAAARAWVASEEKSAGLQQALIAVQPKVEAFDAFLEKETEDMTLTRAMKVLGYGPNIAIQVMRKLGILYGQPATPAAYYANQEYFVMKPVPDRHDDNKVRPQTFVTPRGLDWLRRRLPEMMMKVGRAA